MIRFQIRLCKQKQGFLGHPKIIITFILTICACVKLVNAKCQLQYSPSIDFFCSSVQVIHPIEMITVATGNSSCYIGGETGRGQSTFGRGWGVARRRRVDWARKGRGWLQKVLDFLICFKIIGSYIIEHWGSVSSNISGKMLCRAESSINRVAASLLRMPLINILEVAKVQSFNSKP